MKAKYEPGTWVRYIKQKTEKFVIVIEPLFNGDGSISYEVNNHDSAKRSWTINENDIIEEIDIHDKG